MSNKSIVIEWAKNGRLRIYLSELLDRDPQGKFRTYEQYNEKLTLIGSYKTETDDLFNEKLKIQQMVEAVAYRLGHDIHIREEGDSITTASTRLVQKVKEKE